MAACFSESTADVGAKSVPADAVQRGERMTLKNRAEQSRDEGMDY